jgi:hypothetical protein
MGEHGRGLHPPRKIGRLGVLLELWREGTTDDSLVIVIRRTIADLTGCPLEQLNQQLRAEAIACRSLNEQLKRAVGFKKGRIGDYEQHAKKVLIAFSQASARGVAAIAVWDADGDPKRVVARDQVNSHLASHGVVASCAAVCVQELEAWFLADPAALKRCFGRGPRSGITAEPEGLADPKEELRRVLDEIAPRGWDPNQAFARIAAEVDLEILRTKCPLGYGTLRADLRRLVVPAFVGTES